MSRVFLGGNLADSRRPFAEAGFSERSLNRAAGEDFALSIPRSFFLPALNTRAPARAHMYVHGSSATYTMGVSLAVLDFLVLSCCSLLMFPAVSVRLTACVFSPALCALHSFLLYQNKAWRSRVQPLGSFFAHICSGRFLAGLASFNLSVQNST